ncbi:MAG: heparinase II/III family protein [Paracoccaceae bacterium]
MHRLQARRAGFYNPETGFISQPEPRSIGSFAKGQQLAAGNIMLAGHLIEAPNAMLWDIDPPDLMFAQDAHGFAWLDDLAAAGDINARRLAQDWVFGWIERYDTGRGAGWLPDLTGRRLIRWIHHALFILQGRTSEESERFFRALGRQTIFLSKRWSATKHGLPRFEALTGLIYAGLSLAGMEQHVQPATRALARECRSQIDEKGGISTRNPEELLEVFTLLTWSATALKEAGWTPAESHQKALRRMAPTLRSLRHSDGGLARFHGGGRGLDGRLDHALLKSGNRDMNSDGLAMGFARLSSGRTSIIVDAEIPPQGHAAVNAHASTLAFEMTSGRRAVIVNCGSGDTFGEDWRSAGRATPSHSSLYIEGQSSARLGRKLSYGGIIREVLVEGPKQVPIEMTHGLDAISFNGAHDGYVAKYGLTHVRELKLSLDGRELSGEDLLIAIEERHKKTFDRALEAGKLEGICTQIKLHLHPEVDANLDLGANAVSLALKSGEVWVFRHDGVAELSVEPSVYLERGRLQPSATKQVVLSRRVMEYGTRTRWSLAKAQDTALAVRDTHREEVSTIGGPKEDDE